ncbi:hypothetical protein [Dolichospermum circinale]|uniref:hypothetical protein n=1 Tax=Dolichospermum circinale TaxID=109265 RepID=UPI00232B9AD1|nr:hypothetical protein [Dolichospermum circinale]MDB9455253.1 hypothetical protein [Dolichospermum circinale CS-541/06]MDB9461148.1 hypothetical protein [Dolichospermum circinale CS-541/04]MDB9548416.1 hypothetical protein [Dolichospermum circinale CS-1031]
MYFDDQEEIRKVFEETYADNVRNRNLIGYGEMYTEEALWMSPDVDDRYGIEDIVEGFAQTINTKDIDPVFTADEIQEI